MKFRLLVEFDPYTERWSTVYPELPGCATAGDTEEEAVRNAKEALELWVEPSELKPAPLGTLGSLMEGNGLSLDDFR